MQVTFFSSVLNHHQVEFCDEMFGILGNDFKFVSIMEMEEQRKKLKYSEYNRPYSIKMFESKEMEEESNDLFQKSDVVILGVHMPNQLRERLRNKKLTFLYRERIFKKSPSLYKYIRTLAYFVKEYWLYKNNSLYLLAASAYSLKDHKALGMFKGKAFSWGYFPPCEIYQEKELMNEKSEDEIKIFWAGRFLKLKNPQYIIKIAEKMKERNINFSIDMVGDGECFEEILKLINDRKLNEKIKMHHSLPPTSIREFMVKSNIYLFTSNREEGFGVVLVEAMNSGCAVVASSTAGSTNLLIEDGKNGLTYDEDSVDQLCDKVFELVNNRERMYEIGLNAYRTIRDVYNANIASNRFICISDALLNGVALPEYKQGPMKKMR